MNYTEFLKSKLITTMPTGFNPFALPDRLYAYQYDLVDWACRRGKAALFTMTGTGKTMMQAAWADAVCSQTSRVLILAPLAVAKQTVREAAKIGITVTYCRDASEVKPTGVHITNYEILHHFDGVKWDGIVLDESSILKSFTGKTRNQIIEYSRNIPYKLACTATPAPNDYMELGNHAEFLGIMSFTEMLATFFVHDGGETSKWRLKGHAEDKFFEWMASWSVFLTKPSDLGYSNEGFELPALNTYQHVVESEAAEGALFAFEAKGLKERQDARRESLSRRCEKAAEIATQYANDGPFMLWCDLNAESAELKKLLPHAVEIQGSDKPEFKESAMLNFADGNIPVLISKPSICGFGMNWQACHNTAFVGMSDSFEAIFQATKRFHRHGQKHEVNRHLIISEAEGAVLQNVKRKESEFEAMIGSMVQHTANITKQNIKQLHSEKIEYKADKQIIIPEWLQEAA